ncbi:MAG TPA: hypothetical protein VEC10_01815 [Steroidobacteraceae bacterium]|nr:hypothetical protein [Steroidobacteraceae bacterium]
MWTRSAWLAVLGALVLSCATARADDARRPEEPDPGFLEFLGSVDRLAEVNPDYLSQGGDAGKPAKPTPPPPAPLPPPPPPPHQPLPPSASASGGPTNE